jgi:hypothetical protein
MIPGITASRRFGVGGGGGGPAPGTDPYYDDVVSLLHFNAAGTTFTDEKGVTWTPGGNAACGATAPQYGSGALELDGSGDWLDATDADFVHNTRDFTMEAWHRIGATLTGNHFIFSYGGGWGVYALTFNFGWALFDGAVTNVIVAGSGQATPLIYRHIALCRAAGIYRLFVDGVLLGTDDDVTNLTSNAVRIGAQPGGAGNFNGQIDEFRITRRARYTEAFTAPAAPFTNFRAPLIDPHFASVVALLNMEGANGQAWVLDERGNLWTRSGAPTISTAQTPGFGTSCLDDPAAQNYITTASHANFGYGTGDFTIEFFARPTIVGSGGPHIWYDQRDSLNQLRPALYHAGSGDLRLYVGGADRIAAPTGTIVVDTWHHIALCRASGSTRLFVNGVQVGSTFADSTNYEASQILLGNAGDQPLNSFGFTGQFKGLRVTKGVARYPANFTPPSALFPVS